MRKIIVGLMCLIFAACSTPTFYGADLPEEYMFQFDGKLQCAFVTGWSVEERCMCLVVEQDWVDKNPNRSFIYTPPRFCTEDVVKNPPLKH